MKIWIDLDNTPHVPFFKPIIRELESGGHTVLLTARDAFQVCELAQRFGLKPIQVGRHYGRNRFMKVWGLLWRSLQFLPLIMRERPDIGVNHTSRSQTLLCNLLRIPSVMIMDYEHAQTPMMLRPKWEIVPEVLLNEKLHCRNRERIRSYSGIKEDVYAPEFKPDPSLAAELNFDPKQVVITVRPPASEAHYHNPESDRLFAAFMDRACGTPGTRVILLPRNKAQEALLRQSAPHWFEGTTVVVPRRAVDGLNLLWHSDLVVSGGGTMNREAAALGVPVYSTFRGPIGAVDRDLKKQGRLVMIESVEQVHSRIVIARREKTAPANAPRQSVLTQVVNRITEIATLEHCPMQSELAVETHG